GRYTLL
ncbi:hypothetical protein BN1723_020004, partial [Verticillium longisporum]